MYVPSTPEMKGLPLGQIRGQQELFRHLIGLQKTIRVDKKSHRRLLACYLSPQTKTVLLTLPWLQGYVSAEGASVMFGVWRGGGEVNLASRSACACERVADILR